MGSSDFVEPATIHLVSALVREKHTRVWLAHLIYPTQHLRFAMAPSLLPKLVVASFLYFWLPYLRTEEASLAGCAGSQQKLPICKSRFRAIYVLHRRNPTICTWTQRCAHRQLRKWPKASSCRFCSHFLQISSPRGVANKEALGAPGYPLWQPAAK